MAKIIGRSQIKRTDSRVFIIKHQAKTDSPLDVEGIDLDIATAEIVQFIQQGRRVRQAS